MRCCTDSMSSAMRLKMTSEASGGTNQKRPQVCFRIGGGFLKTGGMAFKKKLTKSFLSNSVNFVSDMKCYFRFMNKALSLES